MQFNTAFNCGDKGWTFDGRHVRQRTIGQIRVIYASSDGLPPGGFMEGGIISNGGDNYDPIEPEYAEEYMCVETGIGSGQVYTLGRTIFTDEAACRVACAEDIRQHEEAEAARKAWERAEKLKREDRLRRELAEIEALKAEA